LYLFVFICIYLYLFVLNTTVNHNREYTYITIFLANTILIYIMKYKKPKHSILVSILLLFITLFIILYFIYYFQENDEDYHIAMKTRTIEKDGFCILYHPIYAFKTYHMPCTELKQAVLYRLPPGYLFIDYVYKINNASLSTFHRDVTSSKYLLKTKHTVYTLILYKYDGELLSLCPGSNKTYPFVWSTILNLNGKSGTAVLFDSELLHAGRTNQCKNRRVIQFKLCHKDDLEKLESLQGVSMEKDEVCENTFSSMVRRRISYFFEMPIHYFAYKFMIKKEDSNTVIGSIQSIIPIQYYNNG